VTGQAHSGSVVGGNTQVHWYESVNRFSQHTAWLHTPGRLYAEYGVAIFAILLLVSWWRARATGDLRLVTAALWAPVGALIAIGLNQPLGNLVAEPRPYTVLPHALVLVPRTTDFSFPSDHAVMAGAAAAGVLLVHRGLGLVTLALAVLMAATRVYVGAHFPVDVVAGLLLGALVTVVTYLVVRPLVLRLVEALAKTRLRVLLTHSA